MREAFMAAIKDAMEFYKLAHPQLSDAEEAEAIRDFRDFYLVAASRGLKGIKFNWDGCVLCPDPTEGTIMDARRTFLATKRIIEAAGGRAFAFDVCREHAEVQGEELEEACLRRINRKPPE